MSSSDELPSDIENEAHNVITDLVPSTSKKKYEDAFDRYEKWCSEKNVKHITSEKVLLVYFKEMSETQKPTSLWCYYSMLRTIISIKKNVDIKKYFNLIAFLKRKSEGYKPRKSRVFIKEEIARFLLEAPDERFLCMKVTYRHSSEKRIMMQ